MTSHTTPKIAVLAGATGLVGSSLLQLLLHSPHYTRVLSLGRRHLGLEHPRLTQHIVDFENLPSLHSLSAELAKVDDVFCTLGSTIKTAGSQEQFYTVDARYPLALATWAKMQNAQQFLLVSALGANPHSRAFYNRVKGEAENLISAQHLPATIIARPSLLLGTRSERRPAEQIGQRLAPLLNPLLQGPFKKYRPVEAKQVANALYQLAQQNLSGLHIVESDRLHSDFLAPPLKS